MIYFPATDSRDLNLDSVGRYLSRVWSLFSLDWTDIGAQLINLLIFPERVYQQAVHRKQIKQRFSREDPALILTILFFIFTTTIAYAIAYGAPMWRFVLTPVGMCIFCLIIIVVLAHVLCNWVNKKLSDNPHVVLDDAWGDDDSIVQAPSAVEGLYCLDIAANVLWVFWFYTVVLPFFFLPLSFPQQQQKNNFQFDLPSSTTEKKSNFRFLPSLMCVAIGVYLSTNVLTYGLQLIPRFEEIGTGSSRRYVVICLALFVIGGVWAGLNMASIVGFLFFS